MREPTLDNHARYRPYYAKALAPSVFRDMGSAFWVKIGGSSETVYRINSIIPEFSTIIASWGRVLRVSEPRIRGVYTKDDLHRETKTPPIWRTFRDDFPSIL